VDILVDLKISIKSLHLIIFSIIYIRCMYGWLLDQHSGFVMQKSGAKPKCGGGKVGLIYSSLRNPLDTVNGAYCLMKPGKSPSNYNWVYSV